MGRRRARPLRVAVLAVRRLLVGGDVRRGDPGGRSVNHGGLHTYANLKCRCDVCVTAWNNYHRARGRAVQRLITEHRAEFDGYLVEERRPYTPGQQATIDKALSR